MMKQMTIPCSVLSDSDIESLRVAAVEKYPAVSEVFLNLRFHLIQQGVVTLDRGKIDSLTAGLESLKKRYPEHKLGKLAESILGKIKVAEAQAKITDLEQDVFLKLAQLIKE
jgi:hypothetical protein